MGEEYELFDVHFLRQDPMTNTGNHYAWHVDNHSETLELKKSLIVLLRGTRSRESYRVMFAKNLDIVSFSECGDAVLFDSNIPHVTIPGSGVCMKMVLFFTHKEVEMRKQK